MASSNRLTAANIDLLRSEINHCAETCDHTVLFPGYLPSRLLFIGTDEQGNFQLRLETREDVIAHANWARHAELTRYAALSYCWGPPEAAAAQCKTEWRSLSGRLGGIAADELSPVVRDAVVLARRLGVRYLWVDALCIIQDDVDDWRRESPLMGPVYCNAYVTFFPLNSSSCQEGFLGQMTTATTATTAAGLEPEVQIAESLDDSDGRKKLFVDWLPSAWSRRGWTFQEEKLTSRAIYVGPTRMHFVCSNHSRSEDDAERRPTLEPSLLDKANKCPQSEDAVMSLVLFWEEKLVPQYSHKEFSRPDDKLLAIASLAKYVADFTGYRYVAGLWIERIEMELAWHYRPMHGSLQELLCVLEAGAGAGAGAQRAFIAPSWSWARFGTMHGLRLYFRQRQHRRVKLVAEVQDVSVDTVGPNRYGQVTGGRLRLSTKVMAIPPGHVISNKTSRGDSEVFLLDWRPQQGDERSDARLELIVIGRYERDKPALERMYGIIGCPASVPGTYHRVGIFDVLQSSPFLGLGVVSNEIVTII